MHEQPSEMQSSDSTHEGGATEISGRQPVGVAEKPRRKKILDPTTRMIWELEAADGAAANAEAAKHDAKAKRTAANREAKAKRTAANREAEAMRKLAKFVNLHLVQADAPPVDARCDEVKARLSLPPLLSTPSRAAPSVCPPPSLARPPQTEGRFLPSVCPLPL